MNSSPAFTPAGAILAGGQASRLGVNSKALAPLAGQPLICHVLERLSAQADPILVSVQGFQPELEPYGHEQVEDIAPRHRGPLVGLCSAMRRLAAGGGVEWLLLCPCDAPFLPGDLAYRLHQAASSEGRPVSVAKYQDVLQPTFSLWSMSLYPVVREAVMAQGGSGLWQVLRELPYAEVEWAVRDLPPFFNINTPDDLERAARLAGDGD